MLVLTRKVGERIVIDGNVEVQVVAIGNGRVKLGITAPDDVRIRRSEIVSDADEAASGAKGSTGNRDDMAQAC